MQLNVKNETSTLKAAVPRRAFRTLLPSAMNMGVAGSLVMDGKVGAHPLVHKVVLHIQKTKLANRTK